MDVETELLGLLGVILCLCKALRLKQRRSRRFKVRPTNRARLKYGGFQYYKKMKSWDKDQFFKYTRMTHSAFNKLLAMIRPKIKKQTRTDTIAPEERLVITLQYLSQGSSMQSLAWNFHIGLATVHKISRETCEVLWEVLSPKYLSTPETQEEWINISHDFYNRWNLPHCLGALDGKHINMKAPEKSGSQYFNYKHNFSIVLLATCDSQYKFTSVDIGACGSQSDGGILRNSVFGQRLEAKSLNLPKPRILPQSTINLPYFFAADEAFPLKEYIMRPYPGHNLTKTQRIFNYRLSRARIVIENTFGILAARWRILKTIINAKVETVDSIVKAAVVLHNYCQSELPHDYCPPHYVDDDFEENGSNISKRDLYEMRNKLADHLISEKGKVAWQEEIISRDLLFT